MKCGEVLLGILHNPAKVHPVLAVVTRIFKDARRMLKKSEKRFIQFMECFELITALGCTRGTGPAAGLVFAAEILGVTIFKGTEGRIMLKANNEEAVDFLYHAQKGLRRGPHQVGKGGRH